MPAETTITTEERVKFSLNPTTATGRPAQVDGQATFTLQSGSCVIEQIDALNAWVTSPDTADTDNSGSIIAVSADADLGEGVETITDFGTVHVTSAKATSLGLGFGTPEPKP